MIPLLDVSDFGSPYDKGIFNWDQISGGWERLRAEGLAGGSLAGNLLGLGEAAPTLELPEKQIVGQCDFSQGDTVRQIQEQLEVPVTGYFDEATCAAWQREFGEAPTASALEATTGASCASIVVPRCAAAGASSPKALWLMVGGAAVLALGVAVSWRRR